MQNYYIQAAAKKARAGGGGGSPVDDYNHAYSDGDRTSIITVTTDLASYGGPVSQLVDADFSTNDSFFGGTVVDKEIRFQLLDGAAVFTEATIHHNAYYTPHGYFKWQGSNNGSDWTDIGSSVQIQVNTSVTLTELNGNETAYTYYRLFGTSGNMNSNPYMRGFKFKVYRLE